MQDVLKDSGYDITAVGDAEAAVERLAQQPAFDLLISDVGLPGMNGHDLAKHAMARHPSVTVLLVTGHGAFPAQTHTSSKTTLCCQGAFTLLELLGTVRSTL